jgi:hypothetical protein
VEAGYDFQIDEESVAVPPLKLYEIPPGYSVGDDVAVAIPAWRDVGGAYPAAYRLRAATGAGALLAEAEVGPSSSVVRIATALLQDFVARLQLTALLEPGGGFSGFTSQAPFELTGQNPAPLSRGASCTYTNIDHQTGHLHDPCPLTDGDLETGLEPIEPICVDLTPGDPVDECASVWERVVIDLGSMQPVAWIVSHRLGPGLQLLVERSEDGVAFTAVTSIEAAGFAEAVSFTTRHLRIGYVGTDDSSALATLNEIAVY